ncbi:hypothetical protein BV20DRAFT_954619, partial [Pilatotrama ljubarskyi]
DRFLNKLRVMLEEATGKRCLLSTVWWALQHSGYTMKRVCATQIGAHCSCTKCPRIIRQNSSFSSTRALATGVHRIAARPGQSEVNGVLGSRFLFSMLPALSLDGILHLKVVEGSFTTALFADFIAGLLDHMNPFPLPNSVIVMDNCRIHKSDLIVDMIEERCVICL